MDIWSYIKVQQHWPYIVAFLTIFLILLKAPKRLRDMITNIILRFQVESLAAKFLIWLENEYDKTERITPLPVALRDFKQVYPDKWCWAIFRDYDKVRQTIFDLLEDLKHIYKKDGQYYFGKGFNPNLTNYEEPYV